MKPTEKHRDNEVENKIRSNDILMIPSAIVAVKLRPDAEFPAKEEYKHIGHEVTVVSRCDNRTEDIYSDVNTFATGLVLKAPRHYHLEIVEHPNLYKTGYMLLGGPRIINPDDEDEIILPLFKFKEVEDLELPFKAALVVLRLSEYATVTATVPRRGAVRRDEDDYRAPRSSAPPPSKKAPLTSGGVAGKKKGGSHFF